MGGLLLTAGLLIGAVIMIVGGVWAGVAPIGAKQAPVGLILVGALLYGATGAALWHWAVAFTTALMFAVIAFAIFAKSEDLNG